MQNKSSLAAALLPLFLALCACSTTREVTPISETEKVRNDSVWVEKFSPTFEKRLSVRHDSEISAYLRKVTEELFRNMPEFHEITVSVSLIEDQKGIWKSYFFPGARFYLSVGQLRATQYESEIVAWLAIGCAQVAKRHLIQNTAPMEEGTAKPKPFEIRPEHFAFTEAQWQEAIDSAVYLVYRLNFDPRGVLSVFKTLKENPRSASIAPDLIDHLIDYSYRAIAQYPPLRNPIVKSEDYFRVQKRIKKL